METMRQALSTAAIAAALLLAIAPSLPSQAAGAPVPAATATPPPQIIRVLSRPVCSELHQHIAPAVGMMLQNDTEIKKSPELFSRYNTASLYGGGDPGNAGASGPGSASTNGDASDELSNPSQRIALLGLENLVGPIANNIIAIQKLLDSPALTQGTGNPQDDRQLQETRAKLLKALAVQSASLDIINGFVDTTNMGDLQHAGQSTINAMNQPDKSVPGTPSPDPLTQNPNQAGLPANPYVIDLANVPGMTLGANPVTRLTEALHWTITETATRENAAATAIMQLKAACDGR